MTTNETTDETSIESRLKGYIESVRNTRLDMELEDLAGKHLINDLAMDSLDIINMLFRIEEGEGLDISEADMESHALYEFARLADYIRQQRGA